MPDAEPKPVRVPGRPGWPVPPDDPVSRAFKLILRTLVFVMLTAVGTVLAFAFVKGAWRALVALNSRIPW